MACATTLAATTLAVQRPLWQSSTCLQLQVLERIEIRTRQLHIAQHLIANAHAMDNASERGALMQLNMGEGKTRVILPMLVLALARLGREIVRLNFVGALLGEAAQYLHRTLTGEHCYMG